MDNLLMLVTSQSNATGSLEVDVSGSIRGAPYRGMLAKRHCMSWIARDQLASSGVSNLCAAHFALVAADKPAIVICQRGKSTPLFTCPMQELCSCLAADQTFIYSGTKKGNVYVHQIRTGELITVWQAHLKGVVKLVASKDSQFLFSAGEDGLLKAWNLCLILDTNLASISSFGKVSKGANSRMITPFRSWNAHTLPITDIVIILDTSPTIRIATSSHDRTIAVFDLSVDSAILRVATGKEISTIACTLHKDHLVAGSQDGFLLFIPFTTAFNVQNQVLFSSFELFVNHSPVRVIAMCPDGITCLVASNGSKIRRFHVYTKTVLGDIDLSQSSHSNHALDDISNILITAAQPVSQQHQQQAGSQLQLVPLRKYPEIGENNKDVIFGPTVLGCDQNTLRYLYEHHAHSHSLTHVHDEAQTQQEQVSSSNNRPKESDDEAKSQELGDFLLLPATSSLPRFKSDNDDNADEIQEEMIRDKVEDVLALQQRVAELEVENQKWQLLCQQMKTESSNDKPNRKKRVFDDNEDNQDAVKAQGAAETNKSSSSSDQQKQSKTKKQKKQKGPAKTLRALY